MHTQGWHEVMERMIIKTFESNRWTCICCFGDDECLCHSPSHPLLFYHRNQKMGGDALMRVHPSFDFDGKREECETVSGSNRSLFLFKWAMSVVNALLKRFLSSYS